MTPCREMTPVRLRWTIRHDLPAILEIEDASDPRPWGEDQFIRAFRERKTVCMVAETGDRIVGLVVYEMNLAHLDILKLAVHPEYRRQGIGLQIFFDLELKLAANRRTGITAYVRESNLAGQLFLKSRDFRAIGIIAGHFADTGEDAYLMKYTQDQLIIPVAPSSFRSSKAWQ